jgi:hypothetical protein
MILHNDFAYNSLWNISTTFELNEGSYDEAMTNFGVIRTLTSVLLLFKERLNETLTQYSN